MMNRTFAPHSKPLRHLHIGRSGKIEKLRIGGTMIEKLHITGFQTGVCHGCQRSRSEKFAFGESLQFGIFPYVTKWHRTDPDDRYASLIFSYSSMYHIRFSFFVCFFCPFDTCLFLPAYFAEIKQCAISAR